MREVGVVDAGISVSGYCGHVLLGSLLLMFLLANNRLHDPRNYLAVRKTFGTIIKSCVIWGFSFLAISLVLKIDPPISRMYCAVGAATSMVALLGWRWVLYCILQGRVVCKRTSSEGHFCRMEWRVRPGVEAVWKWSCKPDFRRGCHRSASQFLRGDTS